MPNITTENTSGRADAERENYWGDLAARAADLRAVTAAMPPLPPLDAHCERCHADVSSTRNVNGDEWCGDCIDDGAFFCNDCGGMLPHRQHGGSNPGGSDVCLDCSENYFVCDDCGYRLHNDEYDGEGICTSCAERDEPEAIDDYSADPDTKPVGKGPHFYGVELEVEARQNCQTEAERVKRLLNGFAICKHDGSLNNGFEIVTRPAALDAQRKLWLPFFASNNRQLRSFNTDTCGLHVHCSRTEQVERIVTHQDSYGQPYTQRLRETKNVLSDLTVAKIVCFANANRNRRFMATIAGRQACSWAKFKAKKLGNGARYNPDRYEAVNLQNSNTIEFRIFKGTLKKASVFKAIEFCDAMIKFAAPASRSIKDSMMRSEFTEMVRLGAHTWPHLAAFIEARWFGRTTKETELYGFQAASDQTTADQTEEQ